MADDLGKGRGEQSGSEVQAQSLVAALRSSADAADGPVRLRRSDALLADPARQIDRILANSRDVLLIHADGHLLYMNPPVARFLGARDPEAFAARRLAEFVSDEDAEILGRILDEVGRARRPMPTGRLHLRADDGKELLVEVRSLPIMHEGREAVITMGKVVPSLQKESREAEAVERVLLDAGDLRETAAAELRRAAKAGLPISLLIFQIDRLAALRATEGRQVAQTANRLVAETCLRTLRTSDFVGFVDEDTVGVLLPVTDITPGQLVAERLRSALGRIRLEGASGPIPFTTSAGLVEYSPSRDADFTAVLFRARAALAEAVDLGGDRVHAGL